MDAETRALRREIDATRAAMTEKVEQLEAQVQQRTGAVRRSLDIRRMIRKRPWTMVGMASGTGFALGMFGLQLLRPTTGLALLAGYAWGRFDRSRKSEHKE